MGILMGGIFERDPLLGYVFNLWNLRKIDAEYIEY